MLQLISCFGALSLALGGALPTPTEGFAWPQWDGPERTGVSSERNWRSTGKGEHLWEAELGLGYSTVSVQDGRLYTMGYDREAKLDSVFCLDALTGEVLWQHSYPSEIWNQAHEGGTVNTPSIDGDVVYSLNREGNLYCLDAKTGAVRWHRDLMPADNPHDLEIPTWGYSASPLVVGDELYLNCGRMLSIDKATGEVLWASEDYGHGYGTPIVFAYEEQPLLAALNGRGLGVVSCADGSERWFHEFAGRDRGVNAATPVWMKDSLFISSGTIPGGARVLLGEELKPAWENREMANGLSGCVLVSGYLYGFDQQTLKCIDRDGIPQWEQRGIGNGALTAAGDRLILMGGDGHLIVAEAAPEEFIELSNVPLFDEGRYWTKPILCNGIIYCRSSRGRMIARDHRR